MDLLGLFLLSAATLAFEVNLTRIFAVSQFYHFAFMTVSLALFGFGASGTLLTLFPGMIRRARRTLPLLGLAFAATTVGSYWLTIQIPFDSFSIALNPAQWGVLALHYVALSLPFLCTGAAIAILLELHTGKAGRTYAANLAGSAIGCLLSVALPGLVGAVGVVLICAFLACAAALFFTCRWGAKWWQVAPQVAVAVLLLVAGMYPPTALDLEISPYKSISYALQYPDSRLISQRWNGFSRVDVIESSAIRSLPGQGFACSSQPPPQRGLFVDGDNLSPITHVSAPDDLRPVSDCLLLSLPFRLRPRARALVLDPGGGFGVLVALAEGAAEVAAIEPNPLVIRAVREQGEWAGNLYEHPHVTLFEEEGRAHLARSGANYDVIFMPPPGAYRPVTSGAYSLAEEYQFTVEGLVSALDRLDEGGLLAVVRWLQVPPSESLRAFALAVEAVEHTGGTPSQSLVALRSYNQMLILVRQGSFTTAELGSVREFAGNRFFDLVYTPDVDPSEVNLYNVLLSPDYYLATTGLLQAADRMAWMEEYAFDTSPPTDDRPFFGHFYRWRQADEVLAMAGHVWQPFGGAGYLVLLGLLAVAIVAAGLLVVFPLLRLGMASTPLGRRETFYRLSTFGFLGLAFMLVEVPLLQRFILFLAHPSYAMATVLGAILMFSGLGSLISDRVPGRVAMLSVVGLLLLYQLGLVQISETLLGLPLAARVILAVVGLGPLGILMGIPFPSSINSLQERAPGLTVWAWGINGALSVVASVLAALAALSWGFGRVLLLGGLCYLGAWLTTGLATRSRRRGDAPLPPDR